MTTEDSDTPRRTPAARIDPVVFFVALAISTAFVLWGVLATESLASAATAALSWVIATLGWAFVVATAAFLVIATVLAFSRFGRIPLGKDEDVPEFRTASWIAMMFSAGMGIGLMFFAVAEPISHLASPPAGTARPLSEAAARQAMAISYFHWALHPWAIYAIVGLALAYFTFRRGMPNLISTAFHPLIGDRIYGPIGKSIDILAIFATLFGSATSLGLGALQINGGLDFLWGVEPANGVAVAVIVVLTGCFVLSAVSGVSRGIQWLSNANMVLALLLVLFLLVVGPTVFQLETLVESIGGYLGMIVPASFRTGAFGDEEWLSSWTIFYWAWWISWAPFVGTFIARISKGRTVREFVVGVLLIPSGVSFVWFAVFGGTAIDLQLSRAADLAGIVDRPELALFTMLEQFPFAAVTSFVVIVLVALFFISGADAASVVMGMLSSRGSLSPARPVIIIWGVLTGMAAAILLLAGGLQALQQAAIIAAAPFTLVMIGLCVGLFKALGEDAAPLLVGQRAPDGAAPAAPRSSPPRRGGRSDPDLIYLGDVRLAAFQVGSSRRAASRVHRRADAALAARAGACSRGPSSRAGPLALRLGRRRDSGRGVGVRRGAVRAGARRRRRGAGARRVPDRPDRARRDAHPGRGRRGHVSRRPGVRVHGAAPLPLCLGRGEGRRGRGRRPPLDVIDR